MKTRNICLALSLLTMMSASVWSSGLTIESDESVGLRGGHIKSSGDITIRSRGDIVLDSVSLKADNILSVTSHTCLLDQQARQEIGYSYRDDSVREIIGESLASLSSKAAMAFISCDGDIGKAAKFLAI